MSRPVEDLAYKGEWVRVGLVQYPTGPRPVDTPPIIANPRRRKKAAAK